MVNSDNFRIPNKEYTIKQKYSLKGRNESNKFKNKPLKSQKKNFSLHARSFPFLLANPELRLHPSIQMSGNTPAKHSLLLHHGSCTLFEIFQ